MILNKHISQHWKSSARVGYDRKMKINISNTRNLSVAEIEEFLNAPKPFNFSATNRKEAYKWIESTLVRFNYRKLKRQEKGIVREYLAVMTGYSMSQIARLIARKWVEKHIIKKGYRRTKFKTLYERADIILLAKTDEIFDFPSGPSLRQTCKRQYETFHKDEFKQLSRISASHIYNLRDNPDYRSVTRYFRPTPTTKVQIGERHKPAPGGKPGYIRVDSVHQGDDIEHGKSVYHINFVDEVLQWELTACVPQISERYLAPIFEMILALFPFVIIEFHSDNGSEYINKIVAEILNRLNIRQTKSRPGKSNDNALVETKNNAIIRKEMGYIFIQKGAYKIINTYYHDWLNIFLNFHRPCAYPTITVNDKGKQKRTYPADNYKTPYEKFKSLPNAEQYLKPGITFAQLDKIAYSQSDIDFKTDMNKARTTLFVKIKERYLRDSIRKDN
jgi:transposase InsO family protein